MEAASELLKLKSMYEDVFSSDAGKKVLEDIIKSGRVDNYSGDCEFVVMARDDGKRELALHIKYMAEKVKSIEKTEVIT